MVRIIPAILAKSRIDLEKKMIAAASCSQIIHIDVMDGAFVPNKTLYPEAFTAKEKKCLFEFHLMVKNPKQYVDTLAKLAQKPWKIIMHREAFPSENELGLLIQHTHAKGMKAGVAVSPETPASKIKHVAEKADSILVMSVHPGFGHQEFIRAVLPKIRTLRTLFPTKDIEIDGGIHLDTAKLVVQAGASSLVAGSAIFDAVDPKEAVKELLNSTKVNEDVPVNSQRRRV